MTNIIDDYEEHGNDPYWWISKAEEMIISADILEREWTSAQNNLKSGSSTVPNEDRILSVTILLYAFAIELLLKAFLLIKGQKIIKDNKFILTKKHSLLELSDSAGLTLDDKDKILLDKLTDAIYSWGRYPIPTHKMHWRKKTTEGQGFIYAWGASDFSLTKRIIERLYQALGEKY